VGRGEPVEKTLDDRQLSLRGKAHGREEGQLRHVLPPEEVERMEQDVRVCGISNSPAAPPAFGKRMPVG
jgi:hypothetical protein